MARGDEVEVTDGFTDNGDLIDIAKRLQLSLIKKPLAFDQLIAEDKKNRKKERKQVLVYLCQLLQLRFLNRAALLTEGDTDSDGSITKQRHICTLQQVEDLKTLIRIFPLWSTGILLCTPITVQLSLVVLQVLAMDRHVGSRFQIPAGSMVVFGIIGTSITVALIDRFLIPSWKKLTGKTSSPLQRIGLGHILTILSMAISALVESRRLSMARAHNLKGNSVVSMSALWLVPQLVAVGVAEGFHFPAQVSLYYQEFPKSLKSTAGAMVALFIGIAFYLGIAMIDLLKKTTGWLPNGINDGRMDNVYWVLTVIGIANFGYYMLDTYNGNFSKFGTLIERDDEREGERTGSQKGSPGSKWNLKVNSGRNVRKDSDHKKVISDSLVRRSTTFFFSNFPDTWNENGLWKVFYKHGHIMDIFIAKKKSVAGRRFGFARFVGLDDYKQLEKQLNDVRIESFNLRVNLVK
ncbi:hypothetical protein OSB04_029153 [Centaurea solstitialis]|uniref:RRM domain-containing protein n=1 Tax=Centaurea solstitialis TaxID=347529 RepID=A0AA38VYI4_9ASTR|nr:hypothetical protein OSB04_029153 [Centaurea solstitialis]